MMKETNKTLTIRRNSERHFTINAIIVLLLIICLGGCSPKHYSYSDFKDLPNNEWRKDIPLKFVPELGDSLGYYDIAIAYSFDNDFKYTNMSIVVDIMKCDKIMLRKVIKTNLSDQYGNWRQPGFGAIFQCEEPVVKHMKASDIEKIILWQGLDAEVVEEISKVGVILNPSE